MRQRSAGSLQSWMPASGCITEPPLRPSGLRRSRHTSVDVIERNVIGVVVVQLIDFFSVFFRELWLNRSGGGGQDGGASDYFAKLLQGG